VIVHPAKAESGEIGVKPPLRHFSPQPYDSPRQINLATVSNLPRQN